MKLKTNLPKPLSQAIEYGAIRTIATSSMVFNEYLVTAATITMRMLTIPMNEVYLRPSNLCRKVNGLIVIRKKSRQTGVFVTKERLCVNVSKNEGRSSLVMMTYDVDTPKHLTNTARFTKNLACGIASCERVLMSAVRPTSFAQIERRMRPVAANSPLMIVNMIVMMIP